jgi:glutathione peroxidase
MRRPLSFGTAFVIVVLLMTSAGLPDLSAETSMRDTNGARVSRTSSTSPVYQFRLPDIDGRIVDLGQYKGKVLLLVNTASMCGNTPQYGSLQEMYERYRDRGFEILAFPANNFGQQEPGTNAAIKSFCYTKYSLTFPLFSKISVAGKDQHPLYRYLTEQSPFPGRVTWNFQKYLVDRSGQVIGKYDPGMSPLSDKIVDDIERALSHQ